MAAVPTLAAALEDLADALGLADPPNATESEVLDAIIALDQSALGPIDRHRIATVRDALGERARHADFIQRHAAGIVDSLAA